MWPRLCRGRFCLPPRCSQPQQQIYKRLRVPYAERHTSTPLQAAPAAPAADGGSKLWRWLQTLLDFFTGRYLYQLLKTSREQGKPAGCPFAAMHKSGGTWEQQTSAAAAAGCPAHRRPAAAVAAPQQADGACCGRGGEHEE